MEEIDPTMSVSLDADASADGSAADADAAAAEHTSLLDTDVGLDDEASAHAVLPQPPAAASASASAPAHAPAPAPAVAAFEAADLTAASAAFEAPSTDDTAVGIVQVDVCDPLKSGEGINAFVSYTVTSKRVLPSGSLRHESVLRRYSDFTWLRNALLESHPGYIVAPLPEKAMIGRFTPEFIERRRRGLAVFMQRIAKHAALRRSKDLELFVTASEQELESHRTMKKQHSPTSSGWMNMLSSFSHSVQTTFTSGASGVEKSEDDLKCDAISDYISQLYRSMLSCKTNSSAIVRGHTDLAKAWFEFGLSFTLYGQFEAKKQPDEAALGHALSQLGHCADRISVLLSDQTEKEAGLFLDPLSDYCRLVEAVQEMLKGREMALQAHRNGLAKVESKRAKLELARSKGKANKVSELEAMLRTAEEDSWMALQHLQSVNSSTFDEVERFQLEKEADIRAVLVRFVKLQVEYSEKKYATWTSVLEELERR